MRFARLENDFNLEMKKQSTVFRKQKFEQGSAGKARQ